MCAVIQAGWTEQDRRHRAGLLDDGWLPPVTTLHRPDPGLAPGDY